MSIFLKNFGKYFDVITRILVIHGSGFLSIPESTEISRDNSSMSRFRPEIIPFSFMLATDNDEGERGRGGD